MRGMPFNLQGKGVLEVAEISSGGKWRNKGNCLGSEPTSVLDTISSPSPPTSTSTLSSPLGSGAGGSTDTAGEAAVSDNTSQRWPPTPTQKQEAVVEPGGGGGGGGFVRKDEWATELQPIPTASGGATGAEKCGHGMEDWETLLAESAASPGQEQSLLRWIMGDVDDPSLGLKQMLQGGGGPPDFEGNAGFGIVDQGFGFEPIGARAGASGSGNVIGSINPSLAVPGSSSGFPPNSNNNNNSGRLASISNPLSLGSYKIPCFGANNSSNPPNPIFSPSLPLPGFLPPGVSYQQFEPSEEKPQLFNQQLLINQHQAQNPAFLVPLSYNQQEHHLLPPQPKRHHPTIVDQSSQIPKLPFSHSGQELFLRRQQQQQLQQGFPQLLPLHTQQPRPTVTKTTKGVVTAGEEVAHQNHQQQALVDQLFRAAQMVETGNMVHAREILARLNHQLSPVGKSLQRAAFYFKEALQMLLMNNKSVSSPQKNHSPFDVIFRMGAYKAFSEISPLLQFVNFTCNQALLEALDGFQRIHIIDFDVGLGAQWSSFMQELAVRIGGAPSVKLTAFTSPSSHDPLELVLMQENLTHFANDIGITFELEIVNLDSFDTGSWSMPLIHGFENEAIAVNLPSESSSNYPSSAPSLLRFVKHLSPKIVVSVERGCDRSDLSFSLHFHHALQWYSILLDSLDAVNVNPDALQKIETLLLQPRIENTVIGRHRATDKIPPWRTLFPSVGFSPLTFSNFAETQAEYVVNRTQMRGFQVEKRQASLVLCWQRQELVSASAWRC
ncbi:hypothetical protein HHK36_000379 [Tetracentron sinense]|uniref:Uncharacterized protein n=1 Tax=Tetracentron sinense TaxID=13715 RepID=A0A834ZRU2_TETSI|nr:hypothetical protein HHK36_000379 [Tetracentron sinense]